MIQRPQTVFLLMAIMANIGFAFTPLFGHALADPIPWAQASLLSAILLSLLLTGISIGLFKSRPKQIIWTRRALLLQTAAVAAATGILLTLGGIGAFLLEELASLGLLVVAWGLIFFAVTFIKKDEELVRSMDRIR